MTDDAPVNVEDAPEDATRDARIRDLMEEVSSLKVNSWSESNPLSCHTQ